MTSPARASTATPAAIWTALVIVYIVWGSTYLAIRVVVETAPPMLFMGMRFVAAAALLGAFLGWRLGVGALRVTPRQLAGAGLVGALLLVCGNGFVAVAEQTVPSGLAALLIAAVPLWLVTMRSVSGDRPRIVTLVGTLVGFLGLTVLVLPGGHEGSIETWGVVLILIASLCWSIGSFFSPRLPVPGNALVATVWEMLIGGVLLLIVGGFRGEYSGFSVSEVSGQSWVALAYLAVVGSVVAYSAYVWLLGNAPISLTATYAYVNPVVAVILGALILSESVTAAIMLGGLIVVAGVALVVSAERPRAKAAKAAESPETGELEPVASGGH
jgi:drug/metabolite transporter (DMT)-like permease